MTLTNTLYAASMVCLTIVLTRGLISGVARRYKFFYFQLTCGLVGGLIPYIVIRTAPSHFYSWVWPIQVITTLTGCATFIEFIRCAFTRVDDARAFVYVYSGILLLCVAGFCLGLGLDRRIWAGGPDFLVFTRDFRTVQALLLVLLLTAIFYFGAALNRNLVGILLGYGLYIFSGLSTRAVEASFQQYFGRKWILFEDASYLLALFVYLVTLWSPSEQRASQLIIDVKDRQRAFVFERPGE